MGELEAGNRHGWAGLVDGVVDFIAVHPPALLLHPSLHSRCCTAAEKQLRRKLEAEYGCDLADRKALLRAEINAYLQAEEVSGC